MVFLTNRKEWETSEPAGRGICGEDGIALLPFSDESKTARNIPVVDVKR
jgi:hypothetical protein